MSQSDSVFERARSVMPGGVNSPVRAFKSVGRHPIFIDHGEGATMTDIDGRSYIDYVCSWGPLIHGHRPEEVRAALSKVISEVGTSFGAPTVAEVELAELIVEFVPSIEKVRLVNSGTEATMSAIRLARGFTGRDRIVKFNGCYHGHGDSLLVRAGSGVATLGLPDSPGVPAPLAELTTVAEYNDPAGVRKLFESVGSEVACVIVEPVAGNMGCVPPAAGFLELLRDLTAQAGALLIFDEVMTGFRVARGGAQEKFGVRPDLTTLGKVIGGGLPVGAYGGRADIMEHVAPSGPVYQAGTLSGNPLAVAAGLATLRSLRGPEAYDRLEALGERLERGILEVGVERGARIQVNRVGSMLTVFFSEGPIHDFRTASASNVQEFGRFFGNLLDRGIYWPPSPFEAAFISTAHSEDSIDRTIDAMAESL